MLEEFHQMSIAHDYVIKGGIDYARKLLNTAYGPEAAKKVLDRLLTALGTEVVNFDALHKADPQQLARASDEAEVRSSTARAASA